jgi:hypothetical protein
MLPDQLTPISGIVASVSTKHLSANQGREVERERRSRRFGVRAEGILPPRALRADFTTSLSPPGRSAEAAVAKVGLRVGASVPLDRKPSSRRVRSTTEGRTVKTSREAVPQQNEGPLQQAQAQAWRVREQEACPRPSRQAPSNRKKWQEGKHRFHGVPHALAVAIARHRTPSPSEGSDGGRWRRRGKNGEYFHPMTPRQND